MLDRNDSYLRDNSGQSQIDKKSTMNLKKKVKFETQGSGSMGNGNANFQAIRERPNLEELIEREDDEERNLMSKDYSKGQIKNKINYK